MAMISNLYSKRRKTLILKFVQRRSSNVAEECTGEKNFSFPLFGEHTIRQHSNATIAKREKGRTNPSASMAAVFFTTFEIYTRFCKSTSFLYGCRQPASWLRAIKERKTLLFAPNLLAFFFRKLNRLHEIYTSEYSRIVVFFFFFFGTVSFFFRRFEIEK
jgi:hypothetical protein